MRKFCAASFASITSRKNSPITRVAFRLHRTRPLYGHGMVPQVWELKRLAQQAAIGMRVGAHAPRALRRRGEDRLDRSAVGVKQLFGPVAFQPVLQQLEMRRVFRKARKRNLVRAPEPFGLQPVDLFGSGPALRAAQDDHRPFWSRRRCMRDPAARRMLDRADAIDRIVEHDCHPLMHQRRIVALDEQWLIAIADEKRAQFVVGNAGQDRRIGDLVAVEMQDRQNRAIARRVEELVGMPGSGKRPGFGLPVADDAGDDKVRIVESRTDRHAKARSRARRLRGWSRARRARHGSEFRPETRTAGTACASPVHPA